MAGLDETFAIIDEEASSPEKQEIGSHLISSTFYILYFDQLSTLDWHTWVPMLTNPPF